MTTSICGRKKRYPEVWFDNGAEVCFDNGAVMIKWNPYSTEILPIEAARLLRDRLSAALKEVGR